MDYFLKKRFSFWLVFILLTVNIAAIFTILYHTYSDHSPAASTSVNTGAGKIITSELGLNAEQIDLFTGINKVYTEQSQKILDRLTEKRSEMLAELGEKSPDTSILNAIAKNIGELHTDLKLQTIQNFMELKKICTPDQQLLLSKMYNDMLECEGHFKGYGKQYRHRYRHGQGGGKGWQKNN